MILKVYPKFGKGRHLDAFRVFLVLIVIRKISFAFYLSQYYRIQCKDDCNAFSREKRVKCF